MPTTASVFWQGNFKVMARAATICAQLAAHFAGDVLRLFGFFMVVVPSLSSILLPAATCWCVLTLVAG
jgi:hypothetical protein